MFCFMIFAVFNCSNDITEALPAEIAIRGVTESPVLDNASTQTISFSGYTWYVKSGIAIGPGPNNWNESNVMVDEEGRLHLKITFSSATSRWECAEIWTTSSLGFGTYEWAIEGSLDLHHDLVLGLFNYRPEEAGQKATEIDIEISKWGVAGYSNILNYAVWPPDEISDEDHWSGDFPVTIPYESTKHMFAWSSKKLSFKSMNEAGKVISSIKYAPLNPSKQIPQGTAPVHINLWVYKGKSSTLSQTEPVEIVVSSFRKY